MTDVCQASTRLPMLGAPKTRDDCEHSDPTTAVPSGNNYINTGNACPLLSTYVPSTVSCTLCGSSNLILTLTLQDGVVIIVVKK